MRNEIFEQIKRIRSIADVGLLYCNNEYDKERYDDLRKISLQLLSTTSGLAIESLISILPPVKDYPTAKVDIRAMILSPDKKILMVKESVDNKWSLPGGWADVGYSPKEIIIKECKEETGLDVIPQKLLAVFDKKMHAHPPQPFYVYKMIFYCKSVSAEIRKGFDILDVQYFHIDDLPEISENRILKSQVETIYNKILSGDFITFFD